MPKTTTYRQIKKATNTVSSKYLFVANPVVSVLLMSYNAGRFIGDALDGILSQNDYYTFEIIVSDDFSYDETQEFLRPLIGKYPDRVKVMWSKWNLGPDSGMCNFVRSLKEARGKYVAICEADDFWCDNNKLKDQVSFLERNPDFACSFTQANVENHGHDFGHLTELYNNRKEFWEPEEILDEDFQCATAGMVFRRDLVEKLPSWFFDTAYFDRPLRGLLAKYGKFHCLQRKAVTYRANNWGTWHKLRELGVTNSWVESHKVFKGLASYHKEHRPQLAARRDELASKIYKRQGGFKYLLGHLRHKMRRQPVKIQESITA